MSTTGRLLLPYPESTDSADVPRDVKALADRVEALTAWIRQADFAANAGVCFAGDLKFSAAAAAPDNTVWLKCDGASYLRATYQALFDALGGAASPWGLPDGTHFNVPNLAGRSPIGTGQNVLAGSVARNIGQLVGEEKHTMLVGELASHTHQFSDTQPYNYGAPVAAGGQTNYGGTQTNTVRTLPQDPPTAQPFNVVGPSTVVYVYIKT